MQNKKNIIAEARKEKGYSQDDMSKLLNIPLTSYRNIEKMNNEPGVKIALKVCKILDLNPYDIFTDKD